MTTIEIQQGIIDWLWIEPDARRTGVQLDQVCRNLYVQYFPWANPRGGRYAVLYPLIRRGVIEFYGNDRYSLAPSCGISNDKSILFINMPEEALPEIMTGEFHRYPGIYRCNGRLSLIKHAKRRGIPVSYFSLADSLQKFALFDQIIQSWADYSVIDSSAFLTLTPSLDWEIDHIQPEMGIFRTSKDLFATRLIRISRSIWKRIPNWSQNVDAFNMAVMWTMIKGNWDLKVNYDRNCRKLTVYNRFFPLIIERMLTINTLLQANQEVNLLEREYYLDMRDFKALRHLFNGKITLT
jgi:hypothetical protein